MNTNRKTTIKDSKPIVTPSTLSRLAGASAVAAGVCFIIVGLFHPVNVPESVTTPTWINVHIAAVMMCFLGLYGMAGLYARQAEKVGWLGRIGFVLFSLWLGLVLPFSFVEAFVLPHLATETPAFVEGFLGMFTGIPSQVDLGVLPTFWNISGPMLILGTLLFGIATFRAGVLPRWSGALLAVGALLIPAGAFLPTELEPRILIPIGLALGWMGYALFAERREHTSELAPARSAKPEARQVA